MYFAAFKEFYQFVFTKLLFSLCDNGYVCVFFSFLSLSLSFISLSACLSASFVNCFHAQFVLVSLDPHPVNLNLDLKVLCQYWNQFFYYFGLAILSIAESCALLCNSFLQKENVKKSLTFTISLFLHFKIYAFP